MKTTAVHCKLSLEIHKYINIYIIINKEKSKTAAVMGKIKKGTCMSTAESYQLLFNEKKVYTTEVIY